MFLVENWESQFDQKAQACPPGVTIRQRPLQEFVLAKSANCARYPKCWAAVLEPRLPCLEYLGSFQVHHPPHPALGFDTP